MNMPAHPAPSSRPRRPSPRLLLPAAAVLFALLVILACVALILRQEEFRLSSDYAYMKEFLAREDNAALREAGLPLLEKINEYEDEEQVRERLSALLSPEKLTFARQEDCPADAPLYTVYSDGRVFFTVRLARAGSTLSGFERWRIDGISIAEDSEIGVPVRIEAPKGASVTVNGITLPDEERSGSVPYGGLSKFEASLSDTVCCDLYEPGIFFFPPDVDAVLDGRRLLLTGQENGVYRFSYPASAAGVFSLTVPYGAEVTVNGIAADSSDVAGTGLPYPFLTRFERDLPGITGSTVYRISGLFEEPEITVTYNGIPLRGDKRGNYRLPEEKTQRYTVYAPSDAVVRLNGIAVGAPEITAEQVEIPILDGLTNYAKKRPYLTEYTVTGLLRAPEITATDSSGRKLTPALRYSEGNTVTFLCASEPAPPEKDIITLRAFARYYIQYLYGGSRNTNGNYGNITDMTPGKSPAFEKLRDAYSEIARTEPRRNIRFGTAEYREFISYADSAYSCIVTLPFTSEADGEELEETLVIEILYVFSGSIRRVVNYTVWEGRGAEAAP